VTEKSYSTLEKDMILRDAFGKLKTRGVTSAWATHAKPVTALSAEFGRLMDNEEFRSALRDYVRVHTTLPRAVQMLFTCISMAARAKWQDAPEHIKEVWSRAVDEKSWEVTRRP
jgi:hypothetical protein